MSQNHQCFAKYQQAWLYINAEIIETLLNLSSLRKLCASYKNLTVLNFAVRVFFFRFVVDVRPLWDPFHWYGLTSIPAWISDYIHYIMWNEITYPIPNFNGVTVEVWERVSNFIPCFTGHMVTYTCWISPEVLACSPHPGSSLRRFITNAIMTYFSSPVMDHCHPSLEAITAPLYWWTVWFIERSTIFLD